MDDKPRVKDVAPLVRALYATEHGACGGHLHIVLDDLNVEDRNVEFCINQAIADECGPCVALGLVMRRMSKTQRRKLAGAAYATEPPSASDLEAQYDLGWPTYDLLDDHVTADYSWSAIGVFRRKSDGQLFWAHDSGCSCYGAWTRAEPHHTFTPLRGKYVEFREAVRGIDTEKTDHEFFTKWARYC